MPWTKEDRKVRIFLSTDVVGSTAYKTRRAKSDPADWPRFYNRFFDDFHIQLMGSLDEVKQIHSAPSHDLTFWKLLGDEILYSAVIRNEHDAYVLTKAFHRAVFHYDKDIYSQDRLRVKGTAWIAGFPIRNSEIKPRSLASGSGASPETQTPLDYVGLDIDIGFRLSSTSRAGRMTVSMDLADLLAQNKDSNLRFFHVGWERFKGVFDDKPYPIFWVSEPDKLPEMFPWQEFDCPFTRSFVKEKNCGKTEDHAGDILNLIADIRTALPDLQLFKPYFQQDDMPTFHNEVWKRQSEKDQLEDDTDVLARNSPLGDETV